MIKKNNNYNLMLLFYYFIFLNNLRKPFVLTSCKQINIRKKKLKKVL